MSTGTAVATTESPRKSVLMAVAQRYEMEPAAFEATLRGTVFPGNGTREEFAAFLLVAREYRLNPITRQIYAFPKKGGGIIPVVSIDGWLFLVNEHPAYDGMEFEHHLDDTGELISITCKIFRKDRRMPVVVTEFLSECIRATDPWKMRNRMLRHKAMIQCARYAFSLSGIYDEDEAERFADERKLEQRRTQIAGPTPPPPAESRAAEPVSPGPAAPPVEDAEIVETHPPVEQGGAQAAQDDADKGEPFDGAAWLEETAEVFATCKTEQDVDEAHEMFEGTVQRELNKDQRYRYEKLHTDAMMRTKGPSVEQSTVATPPPADDDDDFPGSDFIDKAPTKQETPADQIRAALIDPARTVESLKQVYSASLPGLEAMIAQETITSDYARALCAEMKAESKRLKAANQDVAPAEPSAPPAGPSAPPSDEDPAATFDRDFRARVAECGTVEELNSLSTNTLKQRNAFGSTHPLYDGWREAVSHRRKQLSGIA